MAKLKTIFLRLFGCGVMVLPFYATTLDMLLLTDKDGSWTLTHYAIFTIGLMLFLGGGNIKRLLDTLINILTSIFKK